MNPKPFWNALEQQISAATGHPFTARQHRSIGGGCINQAWWVSDEAQEYFIKTNAATGLAMFEAEAAGLAELVASRTVRVPRPVCWGSIAGQAYLALEYLPLGGNDTARAMETLGRQLALLHRQPRPYFGWQQDNTIGSTPQPNGRTENWIAFWREQRLGFQLQLAARNGYSSALQRQGEALLAQFAALFTGYSLIPSLLHGDLWSGNAGCTVQGDPVIFDPAVYYGDREADLAMTELFGGFPERFYAAYRETWPLDTGYPQRRTLYNLYHILNHLNLFGSGYRSQAERMMGQLLAELR
ncbi:MAG TPA: fructosamine kinase family protein [Candidatus Competibacteraceae bacterium]|nr:fructosamine kinase family protein [Candidatus Competibacteraceae bacterium]